MTARGSRQKDRRETNPAFSTRRLKLGTFQTNLDSGCVMSDLDDEGGYGAFWGEVQSNIHKALGCLGVITNGSIRDIPMIAPGFQMLAGSIVPSHAYVHVVDYGIDVNVHGMATKSGDLIHADRHGAIVVPVDKIDAMKTANEGLAAREAKIIAAAKAGGGVAAIKAAMTG